MPITPLFLARTLVFSGDRAYKDEERAPRATNVIDLAGLSRTPSLQRFVVAAVFHQIMNFQMEKQVPGLKYLVTLDELNRFAPKDSHDSITEQIEVVAAEGRSQGVILLGAQQQASLVKPRVIDEDDEEE